MASFPGSSFEIIKRCGNSVHNFSKHSVCLAVSLFLILGIVTSTFILGDMRIPVDKATIRMGASVRAGHETRTRRPLAEQALPENTTAYTSKDEPILGPASNPPPVNVNDYMNPCTAKPRDWPSPSANSSGYISFKANGGLNQMRAAICDTVAIARHVNATLIIPDLDKSSYWSDSSEFADLFDVDHFIDTLKDEVMILRKLPPKYTRKKGWRMFSTALASWSNVTYYEHVLLPLLRENEVVRLTKTDTRLANNSPQIPADLQRLRCRVQFHALRFVRPLRDLGDTIVTHLRAGGPFLSLHLRYEEDMLAFTGCSSGCSTEEDAELTALRYNTSHWQEKEKDSQTQRALGRCPLTPEEVALLLLGLGYNSSHQIYVASGAIFGGKRRMEALTTAFPQLASKQTAVGAEKLAPFLNHSSQLAALDYMVSLAADAFLPTYPGNMGRLLEGHRRYAGARPTLLPDVKSVVALIDTYRAGSSSWEEFENGIQAAHVNRKGAPGPRTRRPDKPKSEDYFYENPEECVCGMNSSQMGQG